MVMRLLSLLGFVGVGLAAVVHVVSLAGVNLEASLPAVWWVNHGALLVFLPVMAVSTAAAFRRARRPAGIQTRSLGRFPASFADRPAGPFAALLPRHWLVLGAVGAYAALHFALHQSDMAGCVVYRNEAGFWRHSGDGVRRELTEQEFDAHRAAMFRTFSAAWVVCYLIAAFLCRKPAAPPPGPPRVGRLRFPERAPFVGTGPWREGLN